MPDITDRSEFIHPFFTGFLSPVWLKLAWTFYLGATSTEHLSFNSVKYSAVNLYRQSPPLFLLLYHEILFFLFPVRRCVVCYRISLSFFIHHIASTVFYHILLLRIILLHASVSSLKMS